MHPRSDRRTPAAGAVARRLAGLALISLAVFLVLWFFAVGVVTAAMLSVVAGVVVVAAGSASSVMEAMLEALTGAVWVVLAIVGAMLAAIVSAFG